MKPRTVERSWSGLSLGGYVAMHLAERSPQRVRGLVLAGATAEPDGIRKAPYRALAIVMDTFDGHGLDRLNRWFFRTRFPAVVAEPIVAGGFWAAGGAAALAKPGGSPIPAVAGCLSRADVDPERRVRPSRSGSASGSSRRRPDDARIVRLAGATHLSNLDRPDAFSLAVRRFAEGLDPG